MSELSREATRPAPEEALDYYRACLLTRPDASTLNEELDAAVEMARMMPDRTTAGRLAAICAACLGRLGRTQQAHDLVDRHITEHNRDSTVFRELAYIRAVVMMMENRVAEAIEILERLLTSATSSEADDLLRSRILNVLGGLYGDQGRIEDGMRILEENIVLRERLADPVALAVAYYNYGEAWKRLDDHETAYDYLRRAYVIERAYGQNLQAVTSAGSLAVIAAKRNDVSEALRLADEGVDLAMATGIDHQIVSALLFKAEVLSTTGDAAASERALLDALARTEGKSLDDLRFHALADLAEHARCNGKLERAREALQQARDLAIDDSNDYLHQRLALTEARLCADEGRIDDLWQIAEALMTRLAETQSVPAMLELIEMLSRSCLGMQDAAHHSIALVKAVTLTREADENRTRRRLTAANIRFRSERRQHEVEVERLRNVELAEAMDRLRSANESLQRLTSDQTDIMNLVAHDLRSPLSSIRELLHQSPAAISADDLQQATTVVDHMLSTVNTLLAAQRSTAASTELVNVTYLARQAVDRQRAVAQRKHHVVRLNLDEQLWCNTDVSLVSSILDNLIGNALKHTPQSGFITVGAQHKQGQILVSVSDTGPGIPETVRHRLFEPYGTLATEPAPDSLGLGLYLSKRLAERLGGSVTYATGPHGVGSTFTLALPAHIPQHA